MLLTAVVVAHNSASVIERTLLALTEGLAGLDSEIIVIDNASTDGTADLAEKALDDSGRVVRMEVGIGYGGGVNEGARRARGRYLLMMNDDVIIAPASIDRLIATLTNHESMAMVSPVLCHPDGTPSYTMFRWVPGWRDEMEKIRDRAMGTENRRTLPDGVDIVEVGVLFAACALVEREFFLEVGGFNDVFFIYGQDLDFSRRLASLGYTVAVDTTVSAVHHQDEKLARRPKGRQFAQALAEARDTYYRIWMNRPSRIVLNLWHMVGRDHQPWRAMHYLRRALWDGPSLHGRRRLDPLEPYTKGPLDLPRST